MIAIVFKTGETYKSTYQSIYQYDYGQLLRIQGLNLPQAVEVHFSLQDTGGEATTRIGVTKDGVTDVVIPDSFLENRDTTQNYEIYAFVYLRNETSGRTEYKITMHVTSRPKPEAFDHPEDAEIFKEAIKAVNDSAARSAESEKQAEGWAHGREDLPERVQDNAKYYSEQAREDSKKTDADRKEVERLVESVSGIDEQVTKVENLTKQTQTSATNTALSEQAAKESENNAAQSRAGAEVAEDNAELAAQKAEQDKAIVEQAKNLVKQMGQEVLDNKNLVDKTAQDFILKAQQALVDVNNAGQTQTERVQSAGTTAVENIQTTQGTAAEAVEAAKSEAVQAIQAEGTTQTGKVTTEGTKQVQAVADKGKEVLQSIPDDFQTAMEAKLDKNQGAEHAGKALVVGEDGNVILGEAQEEGTPPIINSATGDFILVNDSAERKIKGLKVFGKSEQVQTTGAQLFNAREALASQIEKGTVSFDSDGKIILNGKFDSSNRQFNITLQPGTYTLSGDDNGIWHIIAKNDSVFRQTLVVDVETTYQCYIASNTYNNRVTTPMINIGDSAKPYEPYTGCKPSPSPEFPQEIVSSGDSGNVTVDMNTGNLFDINTVKKYEVDNTTLSLSVSGNKIIFNSKISTGKEAIMNILGKNNDAIKLPLGKYILSYKSNKPFGSTNGTDTVEMYACIRTGDSTVYRSTGTENYVIFEIKEGDELFLRFDINKSGQSAEFYDIMLNRGEIALPYESYFNQSLTLSTPNGLPGIKVDTGGNYTDSTGQQWITDEIDLARGKYIQRIGRKIFDGAENWSHTITEKHKNNNFQMMIENEKGTINHHSVCNYIRFTNMAWDDVLENLPKIYVYDSQITASFPPESEINSLETWKNYLKEKRDFEIQYVFETPTETELTPETIAAFKILHSNYPTTVISNDENAGMEASYVADTKHYIDKKFEELNQAIVNTQIALL